MPPPIKTTPLDLQLQELISLFATGLNHEPDKVYSVSRERDDDHFYVHMIAGLFRTIDAILSMDKEVLQDALVMLSKAASSCNKYRKKTSWFFKTDYDSYSDGKSGKGSREECF